MFARGRSSLFSLAEIEEEDHAQVLFDDVEEEFHRSLSHSPVRQAPGTPSRWGLGEKWEGLVTSFSANQNNHDNRAYVDHSRDGGRADAMDFSGVFPGPAVSQRVTPVPPTPIRFTTTGHSPITATTVANALLVEELVNEGREREALSVLERMRPRPARDGETNTSFLEEVEEGMEEREDLTTFLDFWAEMGVVERMLEQMGAPPREAPENNGTQTAATRDSRSPEGSSSSPDRHNQTISASIVTHPHSNESTRPSPSRQKAFDELYQLSLSIEHSLHGLAHSIIKDKKQQQRA
jgi:hypothetical protein